VARVEAPATIELEEALGGSEGYRAAGTGTPLPSASTTGPQAA
jgi:hypothetical protein